MLTPCLQLDEKIWRCICIVVFLLILAGDGSSIDSDKLIVNTKWGFVRGEWSRTVRNRTVANFLGIPYALPPVGDLRFRSPQRWNRTWTNIRDASIDEKKCLQYNLETSKVIGSEDCLYLNIFVPHFSERSVSQRFAKLPVLVFVHGGAYNIGTSDSKLYSPDYLLDQDIIFVTLNYRLTAFGFFSTANQISPGNYGLKDIKMALEWIQENIHSFQGNPKSVTLMGHSAGSAATHLLALSKKTEGLFHRYILLSGSALSTWTYHPPRRYRQLCLHLAKLVGCPLERNRNVTASNETTTENPKRGDVQTPAYDDIARKEKDEEIMKCMRIADATRIITMTQYFYVWEENPMCNFGPTLEDESADAILTMHPLKTMKNGLFRDIPAIVQVVKDEGLVKTLALFIKPELENELIENFEEYLPYFLEYHEVVSNTSVFASAIQDFYFNGNVSLGLMHNITEMTTDASITWPTMQALQYMSNVGNSNIYFSYFAYEGTFTYTFASGIPNHYGVAHGDDLNYLFPILNNMYWNMLLYNTMSDITMINIMTEMWTSFVAEGIPKAWQIIPWPNYRDHHEFMRIGIDRSPEFIVQTNFESDRMEFWEKLTHNESEEVMNDVFVNEPPSNNKSTNDANAIDRRVIIQLASLAIIFFYI
ncbi:esterase E4 [Solenopsis invicta]|uniref:esterase E4 n=1 Tax=Solenopsis invicta TaxID=13686 RepID=UPI00193CC18A|nr:esterase E4 [Solenopsis invicta]